MDEIKKKIITVDEIKPIEKDGVVIGAHLVVNKGNGYTGYTLFKFKQDGTETQAYKQWTSRGFKVGSEVGIAFKEAVTTYTGRDGNEKTATNRTIAWLAEESQMAEYAEGYIKPVAQPQVSEADAIEQMAKDSLKEDIDAGNERIEKAKDEIDVSKIPF